MTALGFDAGTGCESRTSNLTLSRARLAAQQCLRNAESLVRQPSRYVGLFSGSWNYICGANENSNGARPEPAGASPGHDLKPTAALEDDGSHDLFIKNRSDSESAPHAFLDGGLK